MKKVVLCAALIALLAGGVFLAGWVQLAVPVDRYAVMVSKTSGVHPAPLARGVFAWSAERLIPRNTALAFFSARPFESERTLSGALPLAETYGALLTPRADFSWSVTCRVSLAVRPASLPALYERAGITTQEALDAFLEQKAAAAAALARDALLAGESAETDFASRAAARPEFAAVDVLSVSARASRLPDFARYEEAKRTYAAYRAELNTALSDLARSHALQAAKAAAASERLEQIGSALQKYPALAEFLPRLSPQAFSELLFGD